MSHRLNTNLLKHSAPFMAAAVLSTAIGACSGTASEGTDNGEGSVSSTSAALLIGPSGHSLDYFRACGENETCPSASGRYVAYGANGGFLFKSVLGFGSFSCTNSFFGGDPAPGYTKACYYANFTYRVNENQSSVTTSARAIAYGANGVFNIATKTGSYDCNNATFGDPIPGPSKACYEALPDYSFAASENGTITGLSQEPVAYGANGMYVYKILNGTQACTNAVFGQDPAVGLTKTCYRLRGSTIADEGGTIPQSVNVILYGSGLNGFYLSGTGYSAHGSCTNAAFGGDPDVGQTKHCFYIF